MHEPLDYYLDCAFRQRNMGLFTADRVIIIYYTIILISLFIEDKFTWVHFLVIMTVVTLLSHFQSCLYNRERERE